jgi:hypothetical protein
MFGSLMTKPLSIAEARAAGILPSPTGKQAPVLGPPRTASTSVRVSTKPGPERAAEKLKPMQFSFQAATGLHTEQYPAYFRIVVEGPLAEKEAVEEVLTRLKEKKP